MQPFQGQLTRKGGSPLPVSGQIEITGDTCMGKIDDKPGMWNTSEAHVLEVNGRRYKVSWLDAVHDGYEFSGEAI